MTETYRGYDIEIKKLKVGIPERIGGPIREFVAVITCPDGRTCSSRKDPQIDQGSALMWAHDWIDEQEDVIKPQNSPDC